MSFNNNKVFESVSEHVQATPTIKNFGVNAGWAATVVHQVVEKLSNGLTLPYLA